MNNKEKKSLNRGNKTVIGESAHIEPMYATNAITPKKEQKGPTFPAPQPIEANVEAAKKDVDENHK